MSSRSASLQQAARKSSVSNPLHTTDSTLGWRQALVQTQGKILRSLLQRLLLDVHSGSLLHCRQRG